MSDLLAKYNKLSTKEIFRVAIEEDFVDSIALLSSFGADAVLSISYVVKIDPSVPILFLDTGKHFAETYDYVETLKKHFSLSNIQYIKPDVKMLDNIDPDGDLWQSNANRCCNIRKVIPFDKFIQEHKYKAVITGRKKIPND